MFDVANDDEALNLLDEYLEQLQAGVEPDRKSMLRAHPELASALDCLEALERLAPAAAAAGAAEPPGLSSFDAVDPSDAVASCDEELPRDFGPYELLAEIGRGGMGVVYKARQKELDRIVAVKMILASHVASPEHVRRFQAEARAAARLRHPHIVPIHEVGQCHGQHYFTMELIEGVSLADQLARQHLDVPVAVHVVEAMARAVDHLHRQGIVHRDLKPANILLDHEGHPYLADFGLAKIFTPGSEVTATGVIAGTPSYMSPEQAAGHTSQIGPAADVYSLGAILYELLTGRPPFREESPLDTLMSVLSSDPMAPRRLNPRIPFGLELICLKCLSKLPGDRYGSAAALADDLERFARGEPLEVRPPQIAQRLGRWARRRPALASRMAALGLFYCIECGNYALRAVDADFHWKVTALLGLWALVSVVCQQFLDSRKWSLPARFVWGTLDSLLLLAVLLLLANGAASPLVVGYPLLIVASGLWFRVRFVWFMTSLSLVSYSILIWDFYCRRPELQANFDDRFQRHVIFVVALVVLASAVAYLVDRVRTLSSFYGARPPQ